MIICLSIFLKLYLYSNILQQSFYEYRNVFRFAFKRFLILYLSTFLLIFNILFPNIIVLILAICSVIFQYIFFYLNLKIRLKFTKRLMRLWLILLLFFVPFFVFNQLIFIDILLIFLLPISSFICRPFEKIINKKHLNKAKFTINKSNGIKIAVTGSYGKTSTKHYLFDVLKNKYLVSHSPHSYNTPLGLARYINQSNLELADFVIFEFGARRVGDIKELGMLYHYDVAVITGISQMHIDTFKSIQNITLEKMDLLTYVNENGFAILNYENEYIRNFKTDIKKYTYGFNYGDFQAKNIIISVFKTEFDLYVFDVFKKRITLNLLGRQSVLNVMPSIIFCYLYNLDYDLVTTIKPVSNRLSLRKCIDYYILDDAYNSNILGATYALEVLKSHDGIKILITPGFVEMDQVIDEMVMLYAKEIINSVDLCILIKNRFTVLLYRYLSDAKKEVIFVKDFNEGFSLFLKRKIANCILLIENDLPDAF